MLDTFAGGLNCQESIRAIPLGCSAAANGAFTLKILPTTSPRAWLRQSSALEHRADAAGARKLPTRIPIQQPCPQLAGAPARVGFPRLHEKVLHRLARRLGVVMRSSRPFLQSCHIMARLLVAPNPHVRRLPADTKEPRQLSHIDSSTFGLIPSPFPLEHQLRPLRHRSRPFPGHPCSSPSCQRCSWAINIPLSGMFVV